MTDIWSEPKPVCEYPGCEKEAFPCFLPTENQDAYEETPEAFYCVEHAKKNGYCVQCGCLVVTFEEGDLCEFCTAMEDREREFYEYGGGNTERYGEEIKA